MSWYLEDVQDTLEDSTDAAGARVTRERRTVVLWQVWESAMFPSEIGTSKGTITWLVGSSSYSKVLASGKTYLCTQDGLSDVVHPTGKSVRRQVWTYVSEFAAQSGFGT